MAQRSLPQAGDGVGGDAGPYNSDQWAEYFQVTFTGDQEAKQGPLKRYLNELEVTKAGVTITTLNGAGFVYGHFLIVDPAIGINIALAAFGLERIDRVVMLENNTNGIYNPGNLALPGAYIGGIPRNSARIAILQGAEAGAAVLPDLITGVGGIYMVELARFLVTNAAIGDIDDRRDFCTFSSHINTREDFVTPCVSYNSTAGTAPLAYPLSPYGLIMPNDAISTIAGVWIIPSNWDESTITITAVIDPAVNGNIYSDNTVRIGACDEDPGGDIETTGSQAVAVANNVNNCIQPVSVSIINYDIGDILTLQYTRTASHASDTVEGIVLGRGWIVSYGVR